jgi:hypothetical protein
MVFTGLGGAFAANLSRQPILIEDRKSAAASNPGTLTVKPNKPKKLRKPKKAKAEKVQKKTVPKKKAGGTKKKKAAKKTESSYKLY